MLKDNEEAVSYGFLMIVIFLIFGAFIYGCVGALYNEIIGVANEQITEGTMSEQTRNAMEFNRNFCMGLPIVMLIGAFIWGIHRSIGGSGITYGAFHTGFVIMIACCIVGFIMAFLGGLLIDSLYTELDDQGYINGGEHINAKWGSIQESTSNFFINLYFFIAYIVPVLGAAVFFKSTVVETSGSQYLRV